MSLIIDITTIKRWRRFPVGIVRTQLEFVRYSLLQLPETKYIYFSDDKSAILFEETIAVKRLVEQYDESSWKATDKKNKANTLTEKQPNSFLVKCRKMLTMLQNKQYIPFLKIIHNRLPISIAKPIRGFLEPLIRKRLDRMSMNSQLNQNQTLQEKLFVSEIVQANEYIDVFDETDKIVSIGLDWDFSNYDLLMQIKKKCNFTFISCFYDAIPLTHPHLVHSNFFGQIFFLHLYKLINLSDKVFCISDYSKEVLIKIISDNDIETKSQLKTIHLGSDLKSVTPKEIKLSSKSKPYILYVSTIEARKNHIFLLHVWQELLNIYGDKTPSLVLVGMHGWGNDEFFNLYHKTPLLQKYVKIECSVSDEELASLYTNSLFCVFPSIVEGWGLGAAEALSYGKACLVSDAAALQEATQGLMPSLNLEVEPWVKKISALINDESEISKLETIIRNKFIKKDWSSFSEDFHNFIEDKT